MCLQCGRRIEHFAAFKDALVNDSPEAFGFIWAESRLAKEICTIISWFKSDGFGADIPALRKEEPQS